MNLTDRLFWFAKKSSPVAAISSFCLAIILWLVWGTSLGDYQNFLFCSTPYPRCVYDITLVMEIQDLALFSLAILTLGLLFDRRRRGCFELSLLGVFAMLLTYTAYLFFLW